MGEDSQIRRKAKVQSGLQADTSEDVKKQCTLCPKALLMPLLSQASLMHMSHLQATHSQGTEELHKVWTGKSLKV